jgi:hypothetical protein
VGGLVHRAVKPVFAAFDIPCIRSAFHRRETDLTFCNHNTFFQ